WLESAVIGVASKDPSAYLSTALDAGSAEGLKEFVAQLTTQVASKPAIAGALVVSASSKSSSADSLKQAVLENLAKGSKGDSAPEWTMELKEAFQKLLGSSNPALPAAALPLVARWDKSGSLAGDTKKLVQSLTGKLADEKQSDETRAQVAASL